MISRQMDQLRWAEICSRRWKCDLLSALDRIAEAYRANYGR